MYFGEVLKSMMVHFSGFTSEFYSESLTSKNKLICVNKCYISYIVVWQQWREDSSFSEIHCWLALMKDKKIYVNMSN